ncbi:MAG: hypothetical protein LIO87_07775 [Eubacterium sp.]|nr:hypothetical protein [Eubacterium sp.]
MYTNIPGVQILISLLKQFNVCHVVISPGTRNTAFVGSIEEDSFFHCYSIVDERSAGFFALGIAEMLDVPVCVSCTAATATANYAPAMKEAFERGLQLIALTADQDTYTMFHMEDQCINQVDMFHDFVKLAVDVPKVDNKDDYWYCNRKINEALLEMNHHGKGPIQINYRMNYSLNDISAYPVAELPATRKITRIEDVRSMLEMRNSLKEKNRILLGCGSITATEELKRSVKKFYDSYNCVVVYDTFSNLSSSEYIRPTSLGDIATPKVIEELMPDLIITVGNVYYSTIKYFLPRYAESSEPWQISVYGMPIDGYRNLKFVFECLPETFFSAVTDGQDVTNNHVYDNLWKKWTSNITVDNLPFTNFSVIQKVCSMIPAGSILHTSVLDAIRMSNYVEMNCEVSCFANIGADGIDGALSAFLGQAHETDRLSFLLIGDLSLM